MSSAWTDALDRALRHTWAKPGLGFVVTLPFAWLVWAALNEKLGANPAEALIRSSGDWTLRFLCVALAVTPLRQGLRLPVVARFRRMLGLTVFAYACVHLSAYVWLDMGADWAVVVADVLQRPFIALGMASWGLLLALALTSSNAAVHWLGARRWRQLHRCVYAVAVLAIAHFWWMRAGKNSFAEVWAYGGVLSTLLVLRALNFIKNKHF